MQLSLKNIGKIKNATVEIDGITVIAGENNTGKSTVGRVLYSVFNSFYNIDKQIYNEKIQSLENILALLYRTVASGLISRVDFEEIAYHILNNAHTYESIEQLNQDVWKFIVQYDGDFEKFQQTSDGKELVERIYQVLQVSQEEVFKVVLDKKFEAEFYGQVNNVFTKEDSKITLRIKDDVTTIEIKEDAVTKIDNRIDLGTEVIYFDDPFILDEQRMLRAYRNHPNYMDHRQHLKYKLFLNTKDSNVIDEIVVHNKFEKIYSKINEICDGNIIRTRSNGWSYKKANTDKVLDVRNLSTGLKTFIILKTLLTNGTIEFNGTIILDEPEIHLHPEWQLLFAELIVLIQKEFGVHILLNTHSPYFLNAIEVYAAKHEISEKCRYYLARMDGESSCIDDVTNCIEDIYRKLARPLQKLENERYAND